jgi:hypothetical protein
MKRHEFKFSQTKLPRARQTNKAPR